jgi:phosphatidylserine/phosphatidylglycerophosphate/cardiolipin synthase-like enzyme
VEAKKRGVEVTAVMEESQKTGKYSSATFLMNEGIPVFIDAKHAIAPDRIMLIDGQTVVTGSFNFTKAAEEHNAENLLVIQDKLKGYVKNLQEHPGHADKYTGPEKGETP